MTKHERRITSGISGLIGLLGLVWLLAGPAFAQVTIRAYVDKTTMGDAETLLYTIEASGTFRDLGPISAPATRGLTAVRTSPVQSWNLSSINGRQSQTLTLQWQYRPLSTGMAYLGPATLRLDGQSFTTDPITVDVVPQSSRGTPPTWTPSPSGSPRRDVDAPPADIFIRAEPPTTTAYVGEQVVVDYVLHFEPNVLPRNSRIASAWDADGFWREDLELDRYVGTSVATLDGQTFETAPIKRLAVFPTRTGQLQIDSLDIEVDVMRAQRLGPPGSPRSFLHNSFGSRFERETITAPPVTVDVRPLPPDAPASFAGAVGQFGLAVNADRREVEVGEPVRVTATISGSGNIATLEAPDWDAPDVFEQYPARASEQINRNTAAIRGQKTFTFTLVPRYGGRFTLPPMAWTYFEPEAGEYRTLRSDSLRLRVIGPAAPLAESDGAPAPDALIAPRASTTWQRPTIPVPFYQNPWIWTGFAVPALALLGLVVVRRRQRDEDSPYARSLRAFPAAEQGLREATAHLDGGEPRAFYASLERTLRLFLTDRLGTSVLGLSLPDLGRALTERDVSVETRAEVIRLIEESEAAQFGPHPEPPPSDTADRAARLMAAVDAEAISLSPTTP